MAAVQASNVCCVSSSEQAYVTSPNAFPSWLASERSVLETARTFAGFTTTWTQDGSTCLSVTTTDPPVASCLAFFPPVDPLKDNTSPPPRIASIVVATSAFTTISIPGGELLQTSLGDPIADPRPVVEIHPLRKGVILESSIEPRYNYLSHPLNSPIPIALPGDHNLISTFRDIDLLLTRSESQVTAWSAKSLEEHSSSSTPPPQTFDLSDTTVQTSFPLSKLITLQFHPTAPISAFISHDARGLLVLCIVCDSVLTGLSLTNLDLGPLQLSLSFRVLDAHSAVPVLGVRRHHACLDALVQHNDGTLSLFMGRNRMCAVTLPTECPIRISDDTLVLADAVASDFSLIDSSGVGARFSLGDAALSSTLVSDALAALSFILDSEGTIRRITTIYHDLLAERMKNSKQTEFMRSTPSHFEEAAPDDEWALFERVVLGGARSRPTSTNSGFDPMLVDSDRRESHDSPSASDDEWYELLDSDFPCNDLFVEHSPKRSAFRKSKKGKKSAQYAFAGSDSDSMFQILQSMHLLYEDRKLSTLSATDLFKLAKLNVQLAIATGTSDHLDHYLRDFPELVAGVQAPILPPIDSYQMEVPSLVKCLASKLSRDPSTEKEYPSVSSKDRLREEQSSLFMATWRRSSPFLLSERIQHYYDLVCEVDTRAEGNISQYENLLLTMVANGVTPSYLDILPFGVALPLRDAIWHCRNHPNPSWPFAAFALIGREDLFNYADFDSERGLVNHESLSLVSECRSLLQMRAAAAHSSSYSNSDEANAFGESTPSRPEEEKSYMDDGGDGCEMSGMLFRLRFCEDKRGEEVRRLLRSTDVTIMTPVVKNNSGTPVEYDLVAEQKRKLELLLRKRLAAPVGRGAFTLRTFIPSDPTKPLLVPTINFSGKLFAQKGARVSLTPSENQFQWGEFHNGVAAGLRIIAADESNERETGRILTRDWIIHHKPTEMGSATHAGMLLALGLGGYLPVLRKTDYYQYLIPRHELTAIGLMLGLTAGNIASMDEKMTKMLCLHIRPFNEAGFSVPDFHISVNVQTAAILGLGFLHLGSSEHFLLEGLFSELIRRPKPGDSVDDREGLVLAAGMSIGLFSLGLGSTAFRNADRLRIDNLLVYANGGSLDKLRGTGANPDVSGSKSETPSAQDRQTSNLAESETSRVKESNFVHTDVVSPGALFALMLIYLKTNDTRLAGRIMVPDTLYSLDRARPDHVYLRVLAKSLILWDSIDASKEWLKEAVPALLLPVNSADDLFDLQGKLQVSAMYQESDVDVCGLLQARAFAIAGACTAIALKFAGTSNAFAITILKAECEAFEKALLDQVKGNESMDCVYTTGLCTAALALSIVAAGSGDLQILRLLRRLRKRGRPSYDLGRYGSHMATHMAIGFLFMGGGCQTFGTSNVAIVGLLAAIYPKFPKDVHDNQYHLQAFRHLYVLAVEPRCVETRDVDTGTPCRVDVEVQMKSGRVWRTRTPCIVPQANLIEDVTVVGDRYLHNSIRINPPARARGWYSSSRAQVVFVKRKTGQLPYSVDPKGCKGILARSLNRPKPSSGDVTTYLVQVESLVKAFSADPDILAFVRYYCSPSATPPSGTERLRRNVELLYESLSNDKPDAVKLYMEFESALSLLVRGEATPSTFMSLAVADAYISAGHICPTPLVRVDYIASIVQRARKFVRSANSQRSILKYLDSADTWREENDWASRSAVVGNRNLSQLLTLNRFPSLSEMQILGNVVKRIRGSRKETLWLLLEDSKLSGVTKNALEEIVHVMLD